MAKRSATWGRWAVAIVVSATMLMGDPQPGWGQTKPDIAALDEANGLNEEVLRLYGEGKYDAAILLAERALAIREKELGNAHPSIAQSLNNLAELYVAKGEDARAELLHLRTLAIFEKARGPEHPDVATSLNNLARLYERSGDYTRAEPLHLRALAILEKAQGLDHPDVAQSLNNLALLHCAKGEYARAEPLYLRALAIRERALPPDHPDVAISLNNLAGLYQTKGDYARAEPLHLRALAILERAQGPDHPNLASSLNNLAELYASKGDYARAEPLHLRALAIQENAQGKDHPNVAITLNNLAALYKAKGDYTRAAPLLQRALAIDEKTLGPDHPAVATSLDNLAALYKALGDDARAERLLLKALAIREKALRPEHPHVAASLNNLAELYRAKGDYGRAEPLYQRALAIEDKALGPHHPDVATLLNNLALLYHAKNDYTRAEPLYQRALTMSEKALGPDHPDVATSLNNLAILHWAQNDVPRVLQVQERATSIEDQNTAREIAVGVHEQRRAYMRQLRELTEITISLHIQAASELEPAKRLALRTILRRKGLVVDAMANSLANLRDRLGPADRQKFDTWRFLNSQYSKLTQRGPNGQSLDEFRKAMKELDDERQQLENELSFASKDLQAQLKPVTIEQVEHALPKDAALIDLFRYKPFNPKEWLLKKRWGTPRFAAYVLHPNGRIDFADLGDAKPIEDSVKALRDDLSHDATDPKSNARRLHQLVMAPVHKLLGNTRRIYLSPDGDLNLVPFDALVDETGHYLVESFAITYLSSGRDLVRRGNSAPPCETPIVFAGPDYEAGTMPETRPSRQFDPLLYAGAEARSIAALMPSTSTREGSAATEAALKKLHAPKFLHISTHGFFEKDLPALHEPPRDAFQIQMRPPPPVENALLRSGLVFAGANRSGLENEDGLLTALEASQLDLWGTKLVVLSACDTGNGHVENGDGVYGLRRAFAIAGAETVVMSLWQVEGGATTALMKSYYQGLSAGSGRAEALRQAQLGMLHSDNHKHPYYWASFIVSGDDRSMEGRSVEPTLGKISPGCSRCTIGLAQGTESFGWLGLVFTGALMRLRRRSARTPEGRPTSRSS